jgi:acyltransferase
MNRIARPHNSGASESDALAPQTQKRVQWVDSAKGIAILFVVAGHNPLLAQPAYSWVWKIIWLQMPMFFIIAGLFFRPQSYWSFLRSRASALLVPYAFACVLFAPFQLLRIEQFDGVVQILSGYGLGIGATLGQPHLWFLPALFLAAMFFYPLVRVAGGTRARLFPRMAWLFVPVLFAFGSVLAGNVGWKFDRSGQYSVVALPWNGDLAFTIIGYMLVGWLLKPVLLKLNNCGTKAGIAIAFLLIAGTFVVVQEFNVHLDMNRREFSHWWLWFPAIVGSIGWFIFGMNVSDSAGRLLAYLGERSLVVFIFHYFFEARLYVYLGGALFAAVASFLLAIGLALAIDRLIRTSTWVSSLFYPRSYLRA